MNGSSLGGAGIEIAEQPSGGAPSKAMTMSSGPASSAASSALSNAIAGSARLPTITGWTNSTATWRASDRAAGEPPIASSRPPRAKRSDHLVAEAADAVGLGVKNA